MIDNISVLLRSEARDVDYAVLAIFSVLSHMPGALEIVLVVPNKDLYTFEARLDPRMLTDKVVVLATEPLASNRIHTMQATYTRSMADIYCRGKYIFQMRPNSVLVRKVFHKDFFLAGKPIMRYASYEDMPLEYVGLWRNGTADALGDDANLIQHVPVRTREHLNPREVYGVVRSHIERVHGKSFRSISPVWHKPCLLRDRVDECASNQANLNGIAYSDAMVVGGFMFSRTRHAAIWVPLEGSKDQAWQVFVPIITPLICQGHSWHEHGRTNHGILALQKGLSIGNCEQVKKDRAG